MDCRWWIFLLFCWLGPLALGQTRLLDPPLLANETAGEAPADGVLDNAGIFRRNPAQLMNITERLRQLREEHGFLVYVVIESLLVQGNGQTTANNLRNRWIPDGNGLVFVFEVDTRRLSLGQRLEQNFDPAGKRETQIPSYETNAILSGAVTDIDRSADPELFLETFLVRMTDGLNNYFRRKADPVPEGRTVRLGMVIVGASAALALIGLGAAWLLRKSDRTGGGKCFFFPETETEERLGAPYGGGNVSSRRFGTGGAER